MQDKLSPNRHPNESELAYIYRISKIKGAVEGLDTWQDVANFLNEVLGNNWSESAYRKKVQDFDALFEELKKGFLNDEYLELLDKKQEALYKQQVKTQDKMREHRKTLRDEARIEVLISAVRELAGSFEPMDLEVYLPIEVVVGGKEAVLMVSDWHIGAKFKNFLNEYDLEIAKDRLATVVEETIRYCRLMGVGTLHVLNLGDMIEGHIHVTTRVEAEIDAVSQVIESAEMLSWMLLRLEQAIEHVHYHKVLDNHSRVTPSFKEHIEKESFARLAHWWVNERLEKNGSKVVIFEEEVDENIGYIEFKNGKKAAFVHGHLDEVNTVFQNLGMLLDESLDYVFMGHHHIAKMKEYQGGKVFVNGSLKGMDTFLLKRRSYRRASQMLLVMDGKNEIPFVINVD